MRTDRQRDITLKLMTTLITALLNSPNASNSTFSSGYLQSKSSLLTSLAVMNPCFQAGTCSLFSVSTPHYVHSFSQQWHYVPASSPHSHFPLHFSVWCRKAESRTVKYGTQCTRPFVLLPGLVPVLHFFTAKLNGIFYPFHLPGNIRGKSVCNWWHRSS